MMSDLCPTFRVQRSDIFTLKITLTTNKHRINLPFTYISIHVIKTEKNRQKRQKFHFK